MIHASIMAGGKGTRFWPLSREKTAKQFLKMVGDDTLLNLTIKRVSQCIDFSNIWILGSQIQAENLQNLALPINNSQILLEPMGRNTAACIGWGAMKILEKDPDGIQVVLPSDHVIQNNDKFCETILAAVSVAEENDCLVTLGIKPTLPHTGFGYIEAENKHEHVSKVLSFREKPNVETATEFLKSGKFYWNSGMFVWKAKVILDLLNEYMPDTFNKLQELKDLEPYSLKFKDIYATLDNESIDYGIMEKAVVLTKVIPASFDWNDIGNWLALREFWESDEQNNSFKGKIISLGSKNNTIYSEKRLISLLDVEDLIIVDTDDVLLVANAKDDQKVKQLVEKIPNEYK